MPIPKGAMRRMARARRRMESARMRQRVKERMVAAQAAAWAERRQRRRDRLQPVALPRPPRPPATAPAGAAQEPTEELRQAVESLESQMSSLRSEVLLADLNDDVEDLDVAVAGLPVAIEQIRTRGYVFRPHLEAQAAALQEKWRELRPSIVEAISQQAAALQQKANVMERQLAQLQARVALPGGAQGTEALLRRVESALSALRDEVRAAQENIEGMFDAVNDEVRAVQADVEDVAWMLDELDEATFRLRPDENPIDAVEAKLMTSEKEGYGGVFYLTDQRVLFEQKEEVVKSRKLLIFTEKELVQQLRLDEPVGRIQSTQESEKGWLIGKKELLTLEFSGEAAQRKAILQLEEDSEPWPGLIGRVLSGDIDRERVGAVAAPAAEAKPVPDRCPSCGAPFTVDIVRGMTSVKCEFCGGVVAL